MSSPARAVVAGHGAFADGVISAVHQITGRGDAFVGVSNRDLGATELEQALRRHAEEGAAVIFTDLPAGSATIAARRVLRDHPALQLVTGANVPVLLDWLFNAEAADAPARAVEKGRQALVVHGAPRAD